MKNKVKKVREKEKSNTSWKSYISCTIIYTGETVTPCATICKTINVHFSKAVYIRSKKNSLRNFISKIVEKDITVV